MHRGHSELKFLSQVSMHFWWKRCRQGRRLAVSPSSKASRQTGHDCFDAVIVSVGRLFIAADAAGTREAERTDEDAVG